MSNIVTTSAPGAAPSDPVPAQAARIVARRYELGARVGAGGMGTVWLGYDQLLERVVAVKELTGDRGRAAALQEARAAARITHHGVVRVIDVVLGAHARDWIVMELLPGRSLAAAVREDGPFPPTRVRELGTRILEALIAVHRSGLVHRDVKPGNVHLCDDGRVVLTDFGLAQELGRNDAALDGIVEGSPSFMAPESIYEGRFGTASDLYSLGVTLYTAVTGEGPFDDHSIDTLLASRAAGPAPLRKRIGPLRAVIEGLMEPDPLHRMDAATALAQLRPFQMMGRAGAPGWFAA